VHVFLLLEIVIRGNARFTFLEKNTNSHQSGLGFTKGMGWGEGGRGEPVY